MMGALPKCISCLLNSLTNEDKMYFLSSDDNISRLTTVVLSSFSDIEPVS